MARAVHYSKMLYKYLISNGFRDRSKGLPLAIVNDPLVIIAKYNIEHYRCPFCNRKYDNAIAIVNHLSKGDTRCRHMLEEFIQLTITRYYIIASPHTSDILRKLYIKQPQLKVIE